MRIFLTGSTGFLGSRLGQFLLHKENEVYLFKRGEETKVIKDFNPEVIIHLAGELHDEEKMVKTNMELTAELLNDSKDIPYQTFINMGSSSEYGKKDQPMKETDLLEPISLYGATKAQATILCQNFALVYNKPVITLRLFSLYGPGEPQTKLIPTAIRAALNGSEMVLGQGVHDWIFVDDVVAAILYFMTQRSMGGEVVNIGTGAQTSNEEVIKMVEEAMGKKIKIKPVERFRKTDSDCWVADTIHAKELGWQATTGLKEGIEKTIEDYRKNIQ